MFGKPVWFREKSFGWGLRPVTWQGWTYTLGWMLALVLPFATLITRHQVPEALIWLTTTMGLLTWDVWGIRRSLSKPEAQEVLYIDNQGVYSRSEPRARA